MVRMRTVALALSVVLAGIAAPTLAGASPLADRSAPSKGVLAAFSLVAPVSVAPSGLIARAVLPAGVGCPRLDAVVSTPRGSKSVRVAMTERRAGATTLNAFGAVLVCEAAVPKAARSASIDGKRIPAAMPKQVDSVAVLGDSGCRIKGSTAQACNDPAAWPLARVSKSISRDRPDVVLYLGDYFYREAACPAGSAAECGGSPEPLPGAPFTDSAWGWVADVLVPMAPLFASAPVVSLRGNHELCYRGGNGFFLMFDPAFGTADACAPSSTGQAPVVYSPTWSVDLPVVGDRTLRLVMVDSANGSDTSIDDTIAAAQRPLYADARRMARGSSESWLLTHRPISAVVTSDYLPNPPGTATTWTSITNVYSSQGLLDRFDLTLSSHIHLAQATNVPTLPPELVLGNAGTDLDPPTGYSIPPYGPLTDGEGQPLAPDALPIPTATYLKTWVRFGYALATPAKSGWTLELKGIDGRRFATCRTGSGQLMCS